MFYSVGIHINEEVMLCFYSVCICMNEVLVFYSIRICMNEEIVLSFYCVGFARMKKLCYFFLRWHRHE